MAADPFNAVRDQRRTRSALVPMLSEREIKAAEEVAARAAAQYVDDGDDNDCGASR